MGLVFEVNSDQELREKMDSGYIIAGIREYFEEQKAEAELPFSREHLSRNNAIDYIEVSSYETSIDYQTYVYPGNRKLVEDFRELILLAYDQVFSSAVLETQEPEPEPELEALELSDGIVIVDRYFHCMWEQYVENMEKEVRSALEAPARNRCRIEDVRHLHGRISGVISYLFLSDAIDNDAYTRLLDQAWSIYASAQMRIEEVC